MNRAIFDSLTTQESVHLRCETEWAHLGFLSLKDRSIWVFPHLGPLSLKDRSIWVFPKIMGGGFYKSGYFDPLSELELVDLRCETEWVH